MRMSGLDPALNPILRYGIGTRFRDLLCEKARAGIQVRLLVDTSSRVFRSTVFTAVVNRLQSPLMLGYLTRARRLSRRETSHFSNPTIA